jgi:hypothetical protein
MARGDASLLDGRNNRPLDERDQRQIASTFLGLDERVNAIYEAGGRTRFRVRVEDGEDIPEILFGPDIIPGTNIVNPNSTLGVREAAMHELCHVYRYQERQELNDPRLEHIDEALTSLLAVGRFAEKLTPAEIRNLVADAMHRLGLFANQFEQIIAAGAEAENTGEAQGEG